MGDDSIEYIFSFIIDKAGNRSRNVKCNSGIILSSLCKSFLIFNLLKLIIGMRFVKEYDNGGDGVGIGNENTDSI